MFHPKKCCIAPAVMSFFLPPIVFPELKALQHRRANRIKPGRASRVAQSSQSKGKAPTVSRHISLDKRHTVNNKQRFSAERQTSHLIFHVHIKNDATLITFSAKINCSYNNLLLARYEC